MKYNIDYDIAAVVLTCIIIFHFWNKKRVRKPQTNVFIGVIWMSLFTEILDILTVLIDGWRLPAPVVYSVNVVYLVAFNSLPFLYYLYLLTASKRKSTWTVKDKVVLFAPVTWTALLILTSPFTKLIFYYTPEDGYCHGEGFPLLYIATGIYMLAACAITIFRRWQLTVWQYIAVYFFVAATLVGVVLQIVLPNVLLLQFVVALSLLMIYLALENPDDDEDKMLGIFNRRGFEKMIAAMSSRPDEFHVLVISIENFHSVREVVGVEFSQAMLKQMVGNLKTGVKSADLFYVAEGKFAVIVDKNIEKFKKIVAVLQAEMDKVATVGDMNIQLETILLQLDYPRDVESMEDIMDFVDYSVEVPFESGNGEVLHLGREVLNSRRRESRILQAMKQALANESFQVYYQPIYSSREQRFNSAEALIRLFDPNMGFISPDEFIPMAEKNGMILKIGEFVLRTVCKMMAREKIWEKGIDYIEVNLSVVQCMQEDICEMLYGVMDEYDVPYSCVNLEVTETTLARDILWGTMERMVVGGVTFSLDDYGTGYSNLLNVLKYPFEVVKLDKSMVWYSMENERAMLALHHTVAMMRNLGMHIVAEGVETKEQVGLLSDMGCEYLQGYYFSRPVPENDFLEMLNCEAS